MPTTNFDDYSNWCSAYSFGKETVLGVYSHSDEIQPEKEFTDDDYEMIKGNVEQNVIATINEHPETTNDLFDRVKAYISAHPYIVAHDIELFIKTNESCAYFTVDGFSNPDFKIEFLDLIEYGTLHSSYLKSR